MGIETTIYTPRTLGKLVRRMPPVHTFFRDTFFKNRRTFNTKSVDVDFKKGSRALAPFVHPKVGGKTILNTGYQTKSYTPVLLAPNKITTVDDLLQRQKARGTRRGKAGGGFAGTERNDRAPGRVDGGDSDLYGADSDCWRGCE